jgi:outer membrane protein OmpA-like peptidoglycan-associated protein
MKINIFILVVLISSSTIAQQNTIVNDKIDKQILSKDSVLKNDRFQILPMDFNTKESDFGISYYKDKIVFTSTREDITWLKRQTNNKQPFLKIYTATYNENELSDIIIFNKNLNRQYHEGPASFSKDGNFMVYTKNDPSKKDSTNFVQLCMYTQEYQNNKWQNEQAFTYNNPNYSVGHGSLTADGNTMYFTSNMSGGFGGADIYKSSKKKDGTWSKPLNMGEKINTEKDETFPNIHQSGTMLFFTSNTQTGLGGMDIFVAQLYKGMVGDVYNLGTPVNTNQDDFAFILSPNMESGFFSSNREDGRGGDDIYAFKLKKPFIFRKTLKGVVKDQYNNLLANANIILSDKNNQKIQTKKTSDDGKYLFVVDADKEYKLSGNLFNYLETKNNINTQVDDIIIISDLILEKPEIITEQHKTISEIGDIIKNKVNEIKPIYFNLNKFNIRKDATVELDKIIRLMTKNIDLKININSHTDSRGDKAYNKILSEKRAKSVVEYMAQQGIDNSRIEIKGFGESLPITVNKAVNEKYSYFDIGRVLTEEYINSFKLSKEKYEAAHQLNRRVKFEIRETSL